ncbi:uncharacterized protein [Lolium perenne]|uniref:uncharacterized protein n=1 Tax=Lolium perenne TaxID=4522 RepID=UPI0021F51D51|nr:verprolin [Lolium perenne]
MASDTEGIAALFSMYNDDDDDDEEDDADEPGPPSPPPPPPPAAAASPSTSPRSGGEGSNPNPSPEHSSRSLPPEEQAARKTLASPQLSPPPFAVPSPSPPRPALAAPPPPGLPPPPRRGALAIVDYAHDEMAMSPDQEDGEIMTDIGGGLGSDPQDSEGNLEERVLSGTVHILTPNILSETSQHSDAPEQNLGDVAMDATETETEDTKVEEASDISPNVQNDDPLSRFLPPAVTTKCSAALQQKINKFLAYKRAGKSFNAEVRNRKDYRNPDFLQHAVRYQEIDQIGTCFSKDVFNPYGYDKSDYYDEIEADMKRELERKDQEKKRNPKVDFVSSGVQPPINPSIAKISAAISAAAAVAGASGPVAAENVQKEARANKKSKWDKVDGDTNPVAPSGHDSGSAALLSSGNGYAAFAQQKRKEAEEKRTSDYKSDRRS